MINVEITPLKFRSVYFRDEIEPVLLDEMWEAIKSKLFTGSGMTGVR